PEFFEHLAGLPKSVITHRHPAIDRLLQNDFLNIVRREAALDERCAQVHAKPSHLPIAIMVPMTRTRRVRSSKCGRVQISPQAQRVMKSCHSALNESLLASARSTQASPKILRRALAPRRERSSSFMTWLRVLDSGRTMTDERKSDLVHQGRLHLAHPRSSV